MKDRLASIAAMAGLVGLLVLIVWPDAQETQATRPLMHDVQAAGLAAFEQWLRGSDIETTQLRKRYDALGEVDQSSRGNILLAHVPLLVIPEAAEITALHAWVARGNTLVVSTSLFESPAWHLTGGTVIDGTEQLSDIYLDIDVKEEIVDDPETARSFLDVPAWVAISGSAKTEQLQAVGNHELGRDFEDVHVPSDGTVVECCARLEAQQPLQDAENDPNEGSAHQQPLVAGAWSAILEHATSHQAVSWEKKFGDGAIIVLGHPSLLSNAAIQEHDNRRFAMNLIEERLGPDGWVIFDDAHQGENDLYEAQDLLKDVRFLYTIPFLLACWAIYVLADAGSWERATYAPRHTRRGQADLVRASGGYLARRLHANALANGLLAPLRERLAKKWRLPAAQALEDGLALEHLDPRTSAEVAQHLSASGRRRLDPVKLHNLIRKLREQTR